MDIVWIVATAGLWVVTVELAFGLARLDRARRVQKQEQRP